MMAPSSPPGVFGANMSDNEHDLGLVESLRFAVPLAIRELQLQLRSGVRLETFLGNAIRDAAHVGTYGDVLTHAAGGRLVLHGPKRTASQVNNMALAHNGLVRGLAAIAIMTPGGVDFAGVHFCAARHTGCPFNDLKPGPPVTDEDIKRITEMAAEFESWCSPAAPPEPEPKPHKKKTKPEAKADPLVQDVVPVGGVL